MPRPSADRYSGLLSKLPAKSAQILEARLQSPNFTGTIPAAEAQEIANDLGVTMYQLMLILTQWASLFAVAPISNFLVGAIAQGATGNLYFGANMEFLGEALSFCTHAEQSSIVNAWVQGEQGVQALAVNAAPCGYCRQFLYELVTANQLTIIFDDANQQIQTSPITAVLPWPFGPKDLNVPAGLMSPQNHNLVLSTPGNAPGLTGALQAANMSYAPYTNSFAGAAVVMNDNTVIAAPMAENAAYNPSLSPLEGALSCLNLWGYGYSQIIEVALVEVAGAKVSQLDVTRAVLSSVSQVNLTYATSVTGSSATAR